MKKKFRFYTNGERTIKVYEGEDIPEGFRAGRTFNSKPWNKGLTKDDPRVARNASSMRETRIRNNSFQPWNKGLTKETSEILQEVSEKVSNKTKGRPAWNKGVSASDHQKQAQSAAMKGREPWNKGQSKSTNASLLATSEKLVGHECFVSDWEAAKKKEYQTKKKNKSFNSSRPEQELIASLVQEFGAENVIHQYRDPRYPYNCDAYVIPLDLFIEFNGTIEHNFRPYDKNNPQHIAEANSLREKALAKGPKSRYWNILRYWTEVDPKKLSILRQNNLNFKIIYPDNLIIESKDQKTS